MVPKEGDDSGLRMEGDRGTWTSRSRALEHHPSRRPLHRGLWALLDPGGLAPVSLPFLPPPFTTPPPHQVILKKWQSRAAVAQKPAELT